MNQEDARVGDLEHPLGPCHIAVTVASERQRAERARTGSDVGFRGSAAREREDADQETDKQPPIAHER